TFTLDGEAPIDGILARRVRFREIDRPTLIQQNTGDLFATGFLGIAPDSGTILRTQLDGRMTAAGGFSITLTYRRAAKLDMWIPAEMSEVYRQHDNNEVISCTARYSNARRFETSIRLVR